jgi:hypothetical protein
LKDPGLSTVFLDAIDDSDSPADEPWSYIAYAIAFLLTALAFGAGGFAALGRQPDRVAGLRRIAGCAVGLVIGVICGGGLHRIVRPVELLWLLLLMPAVGGCGLAAIRARDRRQSARANVWLAMIAAYLGFAGGLWVWGYLGF